MIDMLTATANIYNNNTNRVDGRLFVKIIFYSCGLKSDSMLIIHLFSNSYFTDIDFYLKLPSFRIGK